MEQSFIAQKQSPEFKNRTMNTLVPRILDSYYHKGTLDSTSDGIIAPGSSDGSGFFTKHASDIKAGLGIAATAAQFVPLIFGGSIDRKDILTSGASKQDTRKEMKSRTPSAVDVNPVRRKMKTVRDEVKTQSNLIRSYPSNKKDIHDVHTSYPEEFTSNRVQKSNELGRISPLHIEENEEASKLVDQRKNKRLLLRE